MIAALRPLILILGWWTFAAIGALIVYVCGSVTVRQWQRFRAYRARRRHINTVIDNLIFDAEIEQLRRSLGLGL